MNVNKRLSKLESQLNTSDDTDSNVIMIDFVRPGQLDARITHIWSIAGKDDCYLGDRESDDDFCDRAAKYIREKNNISDKSLLTMFGDAGVK
jgi:hypothetical protein